MNKTQIEWVKERLNQSGEITRNECLRHYISRLGAIIWVLRDEGWEFDSSYRAGEHGRDYVYKLVGKPQAKLPLS